MEIQIQELLQDTWARVTHSDNLVPLLVGALIVMVGAGFTLGIMFPVLMLGFVKMCFRVIDGEKVEVGQITEGFGSFLNAFLLGLVIVVGIIVTACTIIGPLAIAFISMFAFQILARDSNVGAIDAIKRSFELVKANMGPTAIVFIIGAAISSILGGGTVILGIPAFAFTTLLTTLCYERLQGGGDNAQL